MSIRNFWNLLFIKNKINISFRSKRYINLIFYKKQISKISYTHLINYSNFWNEFVSISNNKNKNFFFETKLESIYNFINYLKYKLKLFLLILSKLPYFVNLKKNITNFFSFLNGIQFAKFMLDLNILKKLNNFFINIQMLLNELSYLSIKYIENSNFQVKQSINSFELKKNLINTFNISEYKIKKSLFEKNKLVLDFDLKTKKVNTKFFSEYSLYYLRSFHYFDNNMITEMLNLTLFKDSLLFFKKNMLLKNAPQSFLKLFRQDTKIWWYSNKFFENFSKNLFEKILWKKMMSKSFIDYTKDLKFGSNIKDFQKIQDLLKFYKRSHFFKKFNIKENLLNFNTNLKIISKNFFFKELKLDFVKAISNYYYIWFLLWKKIKYLFFKWQFIENITIFLKASLTACIDALSRMQLQNIYASTKAFFKNQNITERFLKFQKEIYFESNNYILQHNLIEKNVYSLELASDIITKKLDSFIWNFMFKSVSYFFEHRKIFEIIKRFLIFFFNKKQILKSFLKRKLNIKVFGNFFKMQLFSVYNLLKFIKSNFSLKTNLYNFLKVFRLKYKYFFKNNKLITGEKNLVLNTRLKVDWVKPLVYFNYVKNYYV